MSPSPKGKLKRAIFGLDHEINNPTAIHIAADLASRLELDLVGVFVMDQMLDRAMSYPEAKELSAPFRDWRSLDTNLLRQQQNQMAQRLKTELEINAKKESLKTTFEITSGRFEEVLTEFASQSNILIFIEPKDPLGQITKSFEIIFDLAVRLPSSALIIPKSSKQRKGPILFFAAHKDDPSLEVASLIAQSSGEQLVTVFFDENHVPSEETVLGQIQRSDPDIEISKMSLVVLSRHIPNSKKNKLIAEMCRSTNVPLLLLETFKTDTAPLE